MKELNRREFLTLTGAAVVALSLAGCGGPSAPPAPPAAPTGKEDKVLEAINLFRSKKGWEPFKMDEGLNAVAEEAVKFAKGTLDEDQLMQKILAVAAFNGGSYVNPRFPIGAVEKGVPDMPYNEDVDVMKDAGSTCQTVLAAMLLHFLRKLKDSIRKHLTVIAYQRMRCLVGLFKNIPVST